MQVKRRGQAWGQAPLMIRGLRARWGKGPALPTPLPRPRKAASGAHTIWVRRSAAGPALSHWVTRTGRLLEVPREGPGGERGRKGRRRASYYEGRGAESVFSRVLT